MASYNCDDTELQNVLSSIVIQQFTLAEMRSSPLPNTFPRPRPMVFTPQIAISDIIVGDSSVRAPSCESRLLFRETSAAQGKPPSKKREPTLPEE
jgi:hypothetical protein